MMTNLISVIFNKLVDQWNNTYHHSINKKPKKLKQIINLLNLKLMKELAY